MRIIEKQLQKIGFIKARYKKIDIILMVILPILASVLVLALNSNNLVLSTFLFFGLPAMYLSFRKPRIAWKGLLFATIFAIPLGAVTDYLAEVSGAWFIPMTTFGFKLFGVISPEGLIWGFLWTYFIIVFYEYFLDYEHRKDRISSNIKYFIILCLLLIGLLFLLYFVNPNLLNIDYFYLKISIICVIFPLVLFMSFFSGFGWRYLKMGIYFFVLSLLFELTGVYTQQWWFPSTEFVGYVELFDVRFPLEEFLFWMALAAPALLCYYEYFADDEK